MSWRDEAALARTSALQRTLLDFHAYLQRRKEPLAIMPDDPLQVTDALALSRVPALLDRGGLIDTILDLAAAYVSDRAIERWDDRRLARSSLSESRSARVGSRACQRRRRGDCAVVVLLD